MQILFKSSFNLLLFVYKIRLKYKILLEVVLLSIPLKKAHGILPVTQIESEQGVVLLQLLVVINQRVGFTLVAVLLEMNHVYSGEVVLSCE